MTDQHDPTTSPPTGPPDGGRPADAGAATAAVEPGRGSVARWAIALVVLAIAVGVAVAAFLLLAGGSSPSRTIAFVPAETILYATVRTDLPGDQRQNVAAILGRFPGFDDQANLEAKIDEALDRLVRGSDPDRDYSTQIKPWFGGEVAFAALEVPDVAPGGSGPRAGQRLAIITARDPQAGLAWIAEGLSGGTPSTESYAGSTITIAQDGPERIAYTSRDDVVIVGDPASVRAALDARNGSSLADRPSFQAAESKATGDHLAFLYMDIERFLTTGGQVFGIGPEGLAAIPDWMAVALRAEQDAIVADFWAPNPTGEVVTSPRTSRLAGRLPARTIAALEIRDVGATALRAIEASREQPGAREALLQLEQLAAVLGGDLEGLLGWIGDASIVALPDDDGVAGGLVVDATDDDAARQRLDQLRAILALTGSGAGIEVREETHGAASIVIIDVGSLGGLLPGLPPPDPAAPDASLEIAYAVHDGLVVLGLGDRFVKAVLDAGDETLADGEAYRGAIDRAGVMNTGEAYLDVQAFLELLLSRATPEERARHETEVKPYTDPLGVVALSSSVTADEFAGRVVITFD